MSENKIAKTITRSHIVDTIANLSAIDILLRRIETEPTQEDIESLLNSINNIDTKVKKLKVSILNSLEGFQETENEEIEMHFEESENGKKIL